MKTTVQYAGILAEKAGKMQEAITGARSLFGIRKLLAEKYDGLGELSYVISLNGVIVHEDAGIKEGDQIVLIPPVPGG